MNHSKYHVTYTHPDNASGDALRDRWQREDIVSVISALKEHLDIPRIFSPMNVVFFGVSHEIEDLRGIDLSGIVGLDIDLAFCDLSHALFDNCKLSDSRIQYSVLSHASFRSSELHALQASPVDANHADFTGSKLTDCFFTHSNLEGAIFDNVTQINCDF